MAGEQLVPWIDSGDAEGNRNSMQNFEGDGIITSWDFNFAGGYIDVSHVKAYIYHSVSGLTEAIDPVVLTGPNTIQVIPAVPVGDFLVVYRDTPKDQPLVDYTTGAVLSEANLDMSNQQAVFAAAEMSDRFDAINASSADAIERSFIALETANEALAASDQAALDAASAAASAAAAAASANTAVTTANDALAVANGIDAKATEALANSEEAIETANEALAATTGGFNNTIDLYVGATDGKVRFRTGDTAVPGNTRWALGRHTDGDFVLEEYNASGVLLGEALSFTAGSGTLVTQGLNLSGSATIGGSLNMTSGAITNVLDPTAPQEAATKQYVDYAAGDTFDLIMNPHGTIQQETTTPVTSSNFFADQWEAAAQGTGFSWQAGTTLGSVSAVDAGNIFSKTTAVKASLAASDYLLLVQKFEGLYFRRLKYGTADARGSWVRFRASATQAATVSFSIVTETLGRSYVQSFNVTTTPTDYAFFVPGDPSASSITNTAKAATMYFVHAAGTGQQTSNLGVWQSGGFIAANTQTNLLGTLNAQLNVTDISWRPSAILLPFRSVDPQLEQLRCMRYFESGKINGAGYQADPGGSGLVGERVDYIPKRQNPTVTFSRVTQAGVVTATPTGVLFGDAGNGSFTTAWTTNGAGGWNVVDTYKVNARM